VPPAAGDSFDWRPAPWGDTLVCVPLAHVAHGWTTRQLPLRGAPAIERAGWAAVAASAGLDADQLVRLRQVHGARVHDAGAGPSGVELSGPEADIVVSAQPDRVIAVQSADCVPLLMAGPDGRAVGAAHAGWRGTAAGVAGVSVRWLAERLGARPRSLRAAIGPSIGPCCYEVGAAVADQFLAAGWTPGQTQAWFVSRDGATFLDLWRANADQLERAGVPADRIFVSRLCTACHADWFHSYRRDGPGTGRLAGYIRACA